MKKSMETRVAEYERDHEYGRTPLMWAVRCNDSEAVEWVLKQISGAKLRAALEQRDSWGWTALHLVCVGKAQIEIARLLLNAGADPNLQDNSAADVLRKAVQTADLHLVELLLQNRANVKGENGREALEIARDCGLIATANVLEHARKN